MEGAVQTQQGHSDDETHSVWTVGYDWAAATLTFPGLFSLHTEAKATSPKVTSMMKNGGGQLVARLTNSLHASRSSRLLSIVLSFSPVDIFFLNLSLCSKRKRRLRSKHCSAWKWAKPRLAHQSVGCLTTNVMTCCVLLGTCHSHVQVNLVQKRGSGALTLNSELWLEGIPI